MAAEIGNQYAKKLTNNEIKLIAYKQYCEHIAKGLPKKAWCLRHPDLTLTWETLEKYIKEEPEVFAPSQKRASEADSLMYWFNQLAGIATGDNQKGNVAACQIILRNMHAWDRQDTRHDDDAGTYQMTAEKVLSQISAAQAVEKEKAQINKLNLT